MRAGGKTGDTCSRIRMRNAGSPMWELRSWTLRARGMGTETRPREKLEDVMGDETSVT